jgi:hypothetical protein
MGWRRSEEVYPVWPERFPHEDLHRVPDSHYRGVHGLVAVRVDQRQQLWFAAEMQSPRQIRSVLCRRQGDCDLATGPVHHEPRYDCLYAIVQIWRHSFRAYEATTQENTQIDPQAEETDESMACQCHCSHRTTSTTRTTRTTRTRRTRRTKKYP